MRVSRCGTDIGGEPCGALPYTLASWRCADLIHVAAQPDAAYGKTAIAVALRDVGFLQKFQRAAAGADEDESGGDFDGRIRLYVVNLQQPAPVGVVLQARDLVLVVDGVTLAARSGI